MRLPVLSLLCAAQVFATEVYFSPNGGIKQRIIQEIRNERMSIRAALYFLTDKDLANELAKAARRGVSVELICDQSSAEGDWSKIEFLSQDSVIIYVYDGGKTSIMHHKFWIFSGHKVITGSFNATKRAETKNHENIVVLDDPAVARQFETEFARVKTRSKRWRPENSSWSAWLRPSFA
jgi:phosphatidylserine/phosphatidylglycerophosphate/cardiolipin synthase-like enzyme